MPMLHYISQTSSTLSCPEGKPKLEAFIDSPCQNLSREEKLCSGSCSPHKSPINPGDDPLGKRQYFCILASKSLLEECLSQSCVSSWRFFFWSMYAGRKRLFSCRTARAIRQSSGKPLIGFPPQRVRAVSPHNNVETEILQSKGL